MDKFSIVESFVAQASSFAGDIDWLLALIFLVTGFWLILTEGVLFSFFYRYRAKTGVSAEYITGKEKELKRWVSIPHLFIIVCDIFVIIFAVQTWYHVKQYTPQEDNLIEIDIISQQWAWTFRHPGPDNILGNEDDIRTVDELHVEENRLVHFNLKSTDVLHDFSVPAFRLKQDAIPGRIIKGWFKPTKVGDFDIQCAEMCGIGHGIMGAQIHVQTKAEHASWIKKRSQS